MKSNIFVYFASLLVLSFVAGGCIEVKEDFTVHSDGSGTIEIEFALGKETSAMAGMQFEGKSQEELDAMAAAQVAEDFEGVYWESFTQKMVDGKLTLKGKGVFADINKVKMVSEEVDMEAPMEEGKEPKKVKKEQLVFKFEKTADGGKLNLKMDSGQEAPGAMPGMGGEKGGEMDAEMQKMVEEMLKPMLEQMKGLKVRISAKVPGKVTKSGLQDLGEGRHGIAIDVETIKKQSLAGKAGMDGEIEWTGTAELPTGWAERLKKAKESWEKGAKARAELRKKLEAEAEKLGGGEGEMELEELEKKLKEAEGELGGEKKDKK